MFDLISIGDSTIDTFIQIHNAQVMCDLNQKDCKLCVSFGEKIPVDKLIHLVAGNAANNAVGAKRLGLKVAIYTNVGTDTSGKEILSKFKDEGIDNRYVVINKDCESNFSAVISFKGERTIFVYHQQWKYQLPELDRTRWIYYTSTADSFVNSNIINELSNYLQRTGARLLYNPGTHQIRVGIKKYPQLLALTELFIVNKEEAKKILQLEGEKEVSIKKLLTKIADLGPKMVVITDGIKGSYGTDGEKYYQLGIFAAKLIEMTGSGDAYATGVLAGLMNANSLPQAMRWGAANSASVVEQIGPQVGLLTADQIIIKLKENAKIVAKELG